MASSAGVTLAYDPLGRLYQLTATDGTITRFLYDGDALVAEYNAAGTMTRRYVHWVGADVPIMSYAGATLASPTYLHPDHQGSIVAISGASGLTQINRYDEYGIPAATNAGRFQYTGQIWLAELGMYYYKARIYSPTLGRFMQTDPVGYRDQFNLYAYVGDDPVNRADPTGLYKCVGRANCDLAKTGIAQIRAARDYYRSTAPGSRLSRSDPNARALGRVLDSLGSENDGGVTVQAGGLPGTQRGLYDPEHNTITLDTARIAETSARVEEILGHEGQHYGQRSQHLGDIPEEVRPFAIEHMIGTVPGGSLNPQSSQRDFIRYRISHDGYCRGLTEGECSASVDRAMNDELRKPF